MKGVTFGEMRFVPFSEQQNGARSAESVLADARALRKAGKAREAETRLDGFLRATPDQPEVLHFMAMLLADRGEFERAEFCLKNALALRPEYAEALGNFGYILLRQGKLDAAADSLQQSLAVNPELADVWNNLATTLRALNRFNDAVEAGQKAVALRPDSPVFRYNLGIVAFQSNRVSLAKECFEKSLANEQEIDPRLEATIHNYVGVTCLALGARDEAEASFRTAIDRDVLQTEAHRHLATITRYESQEDRHFALMRGLLERDDLGDLARVDLLFATAKALEDVGDYPEAFAGFSAANALKRKSMPGDPHYATKALDTARAVFDAAFLEGHQGGDTPDWTPILILGPPRSGTTLIEQILSAHPDVGAAGESEAFGRAVRATFGTDWVSALSDQAAMPDRLAAVSLAYRNDLRGGQDDARFIVDKNLTNIQYLGLFAVLFPGAPIIRCHRGKADTCLSIFRHNFVGGFHGYATDLSETIAFFEQYESLMDHFSGLLPGRVFDVDYEALVAEPEPAIRALLEACHLDWHPACLQPERNSRAVLTNSQMQVRRPIHTTAIDQWHRYEAQLAPYRDRLVSA